MRTAAAPLAMLQSPGRRRRGGDERRTSRIHRQAPPAGMTEPACDSKMGWGRYSRPKEWGRIDARRGTALHRPGPIDSIAGAGQTVLLALIGWRIASRSATAGGSISIGGSAGLDTHASERPEPRPMFVLLNQATHTHSTYNTTGTTSTSSHHDGKTISPAPALPPPCVRPARHEYV